LGRLKEIIESEKLKDFLEEMKDILKFIKEENKINNFNLGITQDNFKEDIVKKIKDNLLNDDEDEEENNNPEYIHNKDAIDINNLEGNTILIYYYSNFIHNNLIPPISLDIKGIVNYFTMENMLKIKKINDFNDIEEYTINNSLYNKIKENLKKLKDFSDKYKEKYIKNIHKNILDSIDSANIILDNSDYFYIPLIGLNNAGKSTILNDLIGYNLLPNYSNETTKKGILIKYWEKDYPIICKVKYLQNENTFEFKSENKLGEGIKNVVDILEGINANFNENEEDFFYEIHIKLKYYNDLKLGDKLKNHICLFDLPGFGTNNQFEKQKIYEKLIKCSNFFLFVVRNLTIKEEKNVEMLLNLIKKMNGICGKILDGFTSKCLFTLNCDDKKEEFYNDKAREEAINDINNITKSKKDKIKTCFLNAKFYLNYLKDLSFVEFPELFINAQYMKYSQKIENMYKGLENNSNEREFFLYLKKLLKNKINKEIPKDISIDKIIEKKIKKFFESNSEIRIDEDKLIIIIQYLSLEKEELKKSEFLNDSNFKDFSFKLKDFIENGFKKRLEEIETKVNYPFNQLDPLFNLDYFNENKPKKPKTEEIKYIYKERLNNFEKQISSILKDIKKDFDLYYSDKYCTNENNIINLFNKCLNDLENTIFEMQKNIEKENIYTEKSEQNTLESLKNHLIFNINWIILPKWHMIQNEMEKKIESKLKEIKDKIKDSIQKYSKNSLSYYEKCKKLFQATKIESNCITKDDNYIINSFEEYLSENMVIDKNTKISEIIENIIKEVIETSRSLQYLDWINWAKSKLLNESYFYNVLEYI